MNKQMLVDLAEAYAAHRGLKLSTVSTYVAADGKFFGRLKNKRVVRSYEQSAC